MTKQETKQLVELEVLNSYGSIGYLSSEQCRLFELREKAAKEKRMTNQELADALMDQALHHLSIADRLQTAAHILREDMTQDEKEGTVPRGRPKKQ